MNGITPGAYFLYSISATLSSRDVGYNLKGQLNVSYLINNTYKISFSGIIKEFIPNQSVFTVNNEKILNYHNSSLLKLLLIPKSEGKFIRIGNNTIKLIFHDNIAVLKNYSLYPYVYEPSEPAIKITTSNADLSGYIRYIELSSDDLALDILQIFVHTDNGSVRDVPIIGEILPNDTRVSAEVALNLSLVTSNVKPSFNWIGYFLWDLATAYFPINFILIALGIILLIIYIRRGR
ncbi:MAG: hypothetical protein QXL96_03560 [Ignisphaera sp.]